jgi:hypothetical protein
MTLRELLASAYTWANANSLWVFLAAVAIPLFGTFLAWIGRGGKTDKDGKLIASVVMGVAIAAVALEVLVITLGVGVMHQSALDAKLLLLAAPVVCLVGSVFGIRLIFPLNELGSVRTAVDVGLFVAACLVVLWVFSKFRGWGVVFFGSLTQMVFVGIMLALLLRRLYRRAFKGGEPRAT